jgi:multidrug efflux pump subunit AcrA (membrane-fusion protein)
MSKKKIAFIIVPVILVGGFAFSNFLAGKKELPPKRPKPPVVNYVRVIPVNYEKLAVELEVFGRVSSSQEVDLVSEVGGRLEQGSINLKEGQSFRKGQVLVKVNNDEQKLEEQSRKSNFLNLLASSLPDMKIDFPQQYQTWYNYYGSIELDEELPPLPAQMNTKLKTFLSTRNILSEYYSVRRLEENLTKYTLYAPYNGSITAVNLEIGSFVNPGSNIATLIRTDKLELKVPIQQKDIDYVSVGTKVKIIKEDDGKQWEGNIIRKADFIDPNTQSVNIYIDLNNAEKNLYDGLYLKAIIPGKFVDEGLVIPRNVIRNKNEVFIVEDSVLKTRKINIAKIKQNEAIINGLMEGEKLVVDAPSNASENMKVQIAE